MRSSLLALLVVAAVCFVSVQSAPQTDLLQQLQAQLQQGIAETQQQVSSLSPQQAAPASPLTGGPLINFLQDQQKAYKQHQDQVAAGTDSGASLKEMMMVQQQMSARASAESRAAASVTAKAGAKKAAAKGGDFTPCHTCVFVLERIKKGNNMLLPAICSEVYKEWPESYSDCHQVLNALTYNGNNVRYWLFEGCFKYEVYRAKEWIKPCPSHVMCSVLKNLDGEPFCQALPMEDPFA